MGVLIAVIIIGGVIGVLCFADSVQQKNRIKQLEDRDNKIWETLRRKYANVPDSELYWILNELNWVCDALWEETLSNRNPDHTMQLMISGTYSPLHPVGTARQKLQTINDRYGWIGSDAIQFSRETSASSVFENRYFLACMFTKGGHPQYRFHFKNNQ